MQLRKLLSHLGDARELAPGVLQASLGSGLNRFPVEVRLRGRGSLLRVAPQDFLPAPLLSNPNVLKGLAKLGDLVEAGRLQSDERGLVALEATLEASCDVGHMVDVLLTDCVRLRAAAGGLAAVTSELEAEEREEVAQDGPAGGEEAGEVGDDTGADGGVGLLAELGPQDPGERTCPRFLPFQGRRAELVFLSGPGEGSRVELGEKDEHCLGRSPNVSIPLDDKAASRRHCLLRWVGDQLWLEDLGSYNGTRLNGRVSDRAELHAGDEIEIGWTRLRVDAGPA